MGRSPKDPLTCKSKSSFHIKEGKMNIIIEYKRFHGISNESAKLLAYLSVFIHIIKHNQ